MTAEDPHRRSKPRLWDTDWLVLRALSEAVERAIADNIDRNKRLLDFGCGSMPYRSTVERLGAEYLGADFGGGMLQISPEGSLPVADKSVDAVLSVQVLEHVRDLDRYLGEASRVLKDDGVLLLSTHGTWLYHPHPEDHRRWTRTGLVVDVEARGFAVENIVGLRRTIGNHNHDPTDWIRPLRSTPADCRAAYRENVRCAHEPQGSARGLSNAPRISYRTTAASI